MNEQLDGEGICVLVDGGCHNNNRPVNERSMYGSMTVLNRGKQVVSRWGNAPELTGTVHTFHYELEDGHASKNLAELLTLECGLTYILNLKRRPCKTPITAVTILCDSQLALGYADGSFKVGKTVHPTMKAHYNAIAAKVREVQKAGVELKFKHVDNQWVKSVLGH